MGWRFLHFSLLKPFIQAFIQFIVGSNAKIPQPSCMGPRSFMMPHLLEALLVLRYDCQPMLSLFTAYFVSMYNFIPCYNIPFRPKLLIRPHKAQLLVQKGGRASFVPSRGLSAQTHCLPLFLLAMPSSTFASQTYMQTTVLCNPS